MRSRWLLPPLMLLVTCRPLPAHDGPPFPLLMGKPVGPYKVDVWADPDVGTGTFFVYVKDADGGAADDVRVTVSVAPTSGRLEEKAYDAERPRRGDYYLAEVEFDQQEYWQVRIEVSGPDGASCGVLTAEVEATPPGLERWQVLCYAFPFVLVAVLWTYGIIRHRRRRPAKPDEQKAGPP
jgi:hypothetical protein